MEDAIGSRVRASDCDSRVEDAIGGRACVLFVSEACVIVQQKKVVERVSAKSEGERTNGIERRSDSEDHRLKRVSRIRNVMKMPW